MRFLYIFLFIVTFPLVSHPSHESSLFLNIHDKEILTKIQIPIQDLQIASHLPIFFPSKDWLNQNQSTLKNLYLDIISIQTNQNTQFSKEFISELNIEPFDGEDTAVGWIRFSSTSDLSEVKMFELESNFFEKNQAPIQFQIILTTHWRSGINSENPKILGAITKKEPKFILSLDESSVQKGFFHSIFMGIQHILEGVDHMVFLVMLILSSFLKLEGKNWVVNQQLSQILNKLILIITSFTIGHSVTLLLGSLKFVILSSYLVEILIAISVLLSSIHVFFPLFPKREYWIGGGFGLIHGLAFSNIIIDFGLHSYEFTMSLLGFNLGIEVIQLLIVIILAPILFYISKYFIFKYLRLIFGILGVIFSLKLLFERII